jgi:hypothetical protein
MAALREALPVSLRSPWLISRACSPTCMQWWRRQRRRRPACKAGGAPGRPGVALSRARTAAAPPRHQRHAVLTRRTCRCTKRHACTCTTHTAPHPSPSRRTNLRVLSTRRPPAAAARQHAHSGSPLVACSQSGPRSLAAALSYRGRVGAAAGPAMSPCGLLAGGGPARLLAVLKVPVQQAGQVQAQRLSIVAARCCVASIMAAAPGGAARWGGLELPVRRIGVLVGLPGARRCRARSARLQWVCARRMPCTARRLPLCVWHPLPHARFARVYHAGSEAANHWPTSQPLSHAPPPPAPPLGGAAAAGRRQLPGRAPAAWRA